jgi:hypothetical protein
MTLRINTSLIFRAHISLTFKTSLFNFRVGETQPVGTAVSNGPSDPRNYGIRVKNLWYHDGQGKIEVDTL